MSKRPSWLVEAGLQQLFRAMHAAGGHARVVGGAVRDFMMDREAGDVDMATTLLPEAVMALAAAQGFKAIPTGIAHGTVTLVLPERMVEVTTLRRDVATDGRHATVAFTDDWRVDASRRDFTINAMSMDADGKVYDYFHGQEDATRHRIAFIGEAATRITEDALRIVRFFRFLASHGKPPADAAALSAIAQHTGLIANLSGERIANEMRRLLSVANPSFALRLMHETGVDVAIFGRAIVSARMIRLQMLEVQADYQSSVWARAALLLSARAQDVTWIARRWKLSRHEAAQLTLMTTLPEWVPDAPRHFHTGLLRRHGAPAYLDWLLLQAALKPGTQIDDYIRLAREFVPPIFPVTATDLMAMGMREGKALGDRLAALEQRWEASDYRLSKEELLT